MLGSSVGGHLFSSKQRQLALQYLTGLLRTLVPTHTGVGSLAKFHTQEALFAQLLSDAALSRRITNKRSRF
jgi:hypothetical protein